MLRKLLPHGVIILSAMYLVFFLIDRVNSAMAFINNGITKRLLLVLCALAVVESVWLIRDERRKERIQQGRANAQRRPRQEQQRPSRDYSAPRRSTPSRGDYRTRRDYEPRRDSRAGGAYEPRRRLYDEEIPRGL